MKATQAVTREVAIEVLKDNEVDDPLPMETRKLLYRVVQQLRLRGYELHGKSPMANMSSKIKDSPDIQFEPRLGWWLTSNTDLTFKIRGN